MVGVEQRVEMLKKTKPETEPSTLRYSDSLSLQCLLGEAVALILMGDSYVLSGCIDQDPRGKSAVS